MELRLFWTNPSKFSYELGQTYNEEVLEVSELWPDLEN